MKKPKALVIGNLGIVSSCDEWDDSITGCERRAVDISASAYTLAELDTLIAYLRDEARPWLEEQEKKQ